MTQRGGDTLEAAAPQTFRSPPVIIATSETGGDRRKTNGGICNHSIGAAENERRAERQAAAWEERAAGSKTARLLYTNPGAATGGASRHPLAAEHALVDRYRRRGGPRRTEATFERR